WFITVQFKYLEISSLNAAAFRSHTRVLKPTTASPFSGTGMHVKPLAFQPAGRPGRLGSLLRLGADRADQGVAGAWVFRRRDSRGDLQPVAAAVGACLL